MPVISASPLSSGVTQSIPMAIATNMPDFAAVLTAEMAVAVPAVTTQGAAVGLSAENGEVPTSPGLPAEPVDDSGSVGNEDTPRDTGLSVFDAAPTIVVAELVHQSVAVIPIADAKPEAKVIASSAISESASGPLLQSPNRLPPSKSKLAHAAISRAVVAERPADPAAIIASGDPAILPDAQAVRQESFATPLPERAMTPVAGDRTVPVTDQPPDTPVARLFAALAHRDVADRQWLDTVIRDVATVAGRAGDVRFRIEPDGYGKITVERNADHLEISVSDARSLMIADAARPQVVAGVAVLGAPVAGASVVLDQPGHRSREDARQREQIQHRETDDKSESGSADSDRYA